MKKLVLSAAIAIFGLMSVEAQNVNTEALQLGVRAGYNLSNLNGDKIQGVDTKSLSGFHIGLFTEFPVAPRFSIQPEVIYSTQGSKFEALGKEADLRLQYINVPVLAKVYLANGFNLQAGPQIGFLTGADWKEDGANDVDATDYLKGTDFGLLLGAGYKLAQGVTIDARYNMGLSNITDEDASWDENVGINQDWKNGVFQIGIGYQF
ncbi:MAG: porin family protein [Flavobacteriaceae bacterium]|nr:porin family protein [Flavobacteriaceae bacterium]